MKKSDRLNLILKVIQEEEIDTQEELTSALNARGLSVSQATVSRDVAELNLVKGSGKAKKFRYVKVKTVNGEIPPKILEIFKQVTVSIMSAENIVLIKTLSGNAGTAGMAIDAMGIPMILGTVAGDDTLLAITKSAQDAAVIVKSLRNL